MSKEEKAVQQPAAVGYMNAAFLKERSSEFDQNGTVIFRWAVGECTTPVYLTTAVPAAGVQGDTVTPWHLRVNAQYGIDSEEAMMAEIADWRASAIPQPDSGRDAALVSLCDQLDKLPRRQIKDSQTHSYIAADNVEALVEQARVLAAHPANGAQAGKTEGCAGFQGKAVADCGPCGGAGCDGTPKGGA